MQWGCGSLILTCGILSAVAVAAVGAENRHAVRRATAGLKDAKQRPDQAAAEVGANIASLANQDKNGATLTLETPGGCIPSGATFAVDIWMNDVTAHITGGQFYLDYDPVVLELSGGINAVVPGDAPMSLQVFECTTASQTGGCVPVAGEIGFAVGVFPVPPGQSVTGRWRMARLNFVTLASVCALDEVLYWRENAIPPTRISTNPFGFVLPELRPAENQDETPPQIIGCPPAAVQAMADAGGCSATVALPDIVAEDACDVVDAWYEANGVRIGPDFAFKLGVTEVTPRAMDACGNVSDATCSFDVEVAPAYAFRVEVAIAGPVAPGLQSRCLQLAFYESDEDVSPTVVERTVDFVRDDDPQSPTFGDALGSARWTQADGLQCARDGYICATVQDAAHTLTRQVTPVNSNGAYALYLTAQPLVQGDYYDDTHDLGIDVIDILDYAVWLTERGNVYPAGGQICPIMGWHADAVGDGDPGAEANRTFVDTNFGMFGGFCTALLYYPGFEPRASISVTELLARGLDEFVDLDVDDDADFDLADVAALTTVPRSSGQ